MMNMLEMNSGNCLAGNVCGGGGVEQMGFEDFGKGSASWNLNKIFEILHIFDDLQILINPRKSSMIQTIDICLHIF